MANVLDPQSQSNRSYGLELLAWAGISLLLAKERLMLAAVGAGLVAIKVALPLVITRDKVLAEAFVIAIGILVILFPSIKKWKPSYEEPNARWLRMLSMGAGVAAAIGIIMLLKPH